MEAEVWWANPEYQETKHMLGPSLSIWLLLLFFFLWPLAVCLQTNAIFGHQYQSSQLSISRTSSDRSPFVLGNSELFHTSSAYSLPKLRFPHLHPQLPFAVTCAWNAALLNFSLLLPSYCSKCLFSLCCPQSYEMENNIMCSNPLRSWM